MKTVLLEQAKIYCGNLILVNAQYPLRSMDEKGMAPAQICFPNILMRRDAANILQLILDKIAAGNAIVPVSGYRSAEEQEDIYSQSLRDNGEVFTKQFVALPGHSEHQTGLAIDLGLNQENIDLICPAFPYEGICDIFRKAAPDYGFIERYGKEKEAVTGISHEPWHFRYVGYPHSKIMVEKGFSLEEYTAFLKDYDAHFRFLYKEPNGTEIGIYYAAADSPVTPVLLPEDRLYQISGNNVDGFIVTVWRTEK